MAVIDFTERLAQKQKAQEVAEAKEYFMEVFKEATVEEQAIILESMKTKNMEQYKAVTNPIIMRLAIQKFN